jgi:hypothetical protein
MRKVYHLLNKQEDNEREIKISQKSKREDTRRIQDGARRRHKKKGSPDAGRCRELMAKDAVSGKGRENLRKQKTGSRDESFEDVLTLPRLWVYVVLQTMKLESQRRQMVLPRQLR